MGLVINTNMPAIATLKQLDRATHDQSKTYQRITSGQRIISSADDAAGLSISERLRAQIQSLGQASRNTNQAVAYTQVAEGGLTEISNNLVRLRELAIQAASDTVGDNERNAINLESSKIIEEINRIALSTSFNGTNLLNGTGSKLSFQVGIRNTEHDHINFNASESNVRADALGIDGVELTSIDGARDSLESIDQAFNQVLLTRAHLGATQNRMLSALRSTETTNENYQQARSTIADADLAVEASNMTRANILQQAGVAVLSQANSIPALALRLL